MVISGVIRPPPEIRAVADRTALYVAKNGRAFEQRILGSEKGKTPKFAFLHQTSPFHAYYEDRIQFYENGGEDKKEDEVTKSEERKDTKATKLIAEDPRKHEKTKKASFIDPVAKALLTQRSKIAKIRSAQEEAKASGNDDGETQDSKHINLAIPPPPPFHYINIIAPASLSIAQIESIQLVAQFVALDGKGGSFLSQLTAREWNNPVFGFCHPRHAHFAYFSALVDAYRRILTVWTSDGAKSSGSLASDSVKMMANNVDYCLEISAYRAEYEHDMEKQARKRDEAGLSDGLAKIDWHDFVVCETIDFSADEIVELSMLPPPQVESVRNEFAAKKEEDEMDDDDDEGETIRVVPSYTPKIVAARESKLETVIDPITGKSVPIKDMPEHMRIQLLDPKWAEERKKFQEKQKESNLVSGDIVASNLERLAQARGDTYGKKEHDLLNRESESKKRLEEANRIIRQQAQSQTIVGPSLPGQKKPPPAGPIEEPAAKRPRMDPRLTVPNAPQPSVHPPPLPPLRTSIPPVNATMMVAEDPFAAAATGLLPPPPPPIPAPVVTSGELMSEADFVASLNKPIIAVQVRVPNDPSQMAWNFYGQIVSVTVNVMSDVKTVKTELANKHLNSIPANKIQLKNPTTGAFLKDALTLAALNIGPGTTLELVPRARGGKKK